MVYLQSICIDIPPLDHLPLLYQAVACIGFVLFPLALGFILSVIGHDEH